MKKQRVTNVEDVIWFGGTNNKHLDCRKFERDTRARIRMVRIDSIKPKRSSNANECLINRVDNILETNKPDMIVIQAGESEITDIDTWKPIDDKSKSLDEYKRDWASIVEKDSETIFKVAEDAVKKVNVLQAIIVKQLPRFDKKSRDPLGVKKELSNHANQTLDQLWFRKGGPKNIHIVNVDLGCETSEHLKKLIFGDSKHDYYNGVSLRGEGASRHLSYRAIQSIKPFISSPSSLSSYIPDGFQLPKRTAKATSLRQKEDDEFVTYESMQYRVPIFNRYQGNF